MIAGCLCALVSHGIKVPDAPNDKLDDANWNTRMDARINTRRTANKWLYTAIALCSSALYMLLVEQGRL
jgi:hypothetical protein